MYHPFKPSVDEKNEHRWTNVRGYGQIQEYRSSNHEKTKLVVHDWNKQVAWPPTEKLCFKDAYDPNSNKFKSCYKNIVPPLVKSKNLVCEYQRCYPEATFH